MFFMLRPIETKWQDIHKYFIKEGPLTTAFFTAWTKYATEHSWRHTRASVQQWAWLSTRRNLTFHLTLSKLGRPVTPHGPCSVALATGEDRPSLAQFTNTYFLFKCDIGGFGMVSIQTSGRIAAWCFSPTLSLTCFFHCLVRLSGNIRNTERLSFDKLQSYKIMVTAFDCGQKRAKEDVAVHIDVKPVCKPGWQGERRSP